MANFCVIVALLALHLAAIAYYAIAERQGLVRGMVTGDKRLAAGRVGEAPRGGSLATAAAIAIAAGAAAWGLASLA